MSNGQERRKYRRIGKPFVVRFRTKQYEGLEMSSTKWDMVQVRDISAGGLAFIYTKNLGFNSLLDFKIDISQSSPTINCVGKIVRVEEPKPHSMCRIATEFVKIHKQEREMINATVERVLV
jgi:c-di-GMP-binding flagellar brake protein YcgR